MPLPSFHLRHIPGILSGCSMFFGGMWPLFDAQGAMLEYGFPVRIASAPEAAYAFSEGGARTMVIGFFMLYFYARGQLRLVDTSLAVAGTYLGVIDTYLVWKAGDTNKAIFRFVASGLIAA
ncbi:hypothetical protein F5Y16DRAFT_139511 [Xylariaceae sp. FL0255]|nr:hypothetical protein F5Y16DRAFT_139511 [Xylariaceae sp. FL0255]